MILECKKCGSQHNLGFIEIPELIKAGWRFPRAFFYCNNCGSTNSFALPPVPVSVPKTLSRMAEAYKKFSDEAIKMIDSKTTYDTQDGKGGNFADRMTSPVGWLHDASKYLHEVYQHCLGDTKLTKDEAKRNLYKVAHCCQLAADRL